MSAGIAGRHEVEFRDLSIDVFPEVKNKKYSCQHSFVIELISNWSAHSPTHSPCALTFVALHSPKICNAEKKHMFTVSIDIS